MNIISRGKTTVDITPAGWFTFSVPFFERCRQLFAALAVAHQESAHREFLGLFIEVSVGVKGIVANVLLPEHLTDGEIESHRGALVETLSSALLAAETPPMDSAIVAVGIGVRDPCAAGHAMNVECDICRGECLGGMEYPPDAVELPAA